MTPPSIESAREAFGRFKDFVREHGEVFRRPYDVELLRKLAQSRVDFQIIEDFITHHDKICVPMSEGEIWLRVEMRL